MNSDNKARPPKSAPAGALAIRLLLIRHGQTKLYQAERFWGKTDIDLSDAGTRQAEQLRDRLARTKIDAVYSSTLLRASVTAKIVASRHKLPVITFPELNECSFGFAEGLTFKEISKKYPGLAGELSSGKAVNFPGGESLEQLDARVKVFLEKLNLVKPSSTVAIVAHGGPLRLMICHLLGLGIGHWVQFRIDHASLSIVEIHRGGTILNLLNDTSHFKS